ARQPLTELETVGATLVGLADLGRPRNRPPRSARLASTPPPTGTAGPQTNRRAHAARGREPHERASARSADRIADQREREERRPTPAQGDHRLGHQRDRLRALVLGLRPRRSRPATPARPATPRLSVPADGEPPARRTRLV